MSPMPLAISHKPLAKRGFVFERSEKRRLPAKREGFTLIELLVVIAIIGLLASVGLAAFTRAQTRGRDAKRQADLVGVRSALELYYAENSNYINTTNTWVNADEANLGALTPNYIKVLPSDPKTGWSVYRYRSVNSGTPSTAQGYCLAANREIGTTTTTCTVGLQTNYDYGVGNP